MLNRQSKKKSGPCGSLFFVCERRSHYFFEQFIEFLLVDSLYFLQCHALQCLEVSIVVDGSATILLGEFIKLGTDDGFFLSLYCERYKMEGCEVQILFCIFHYFRIIIQLFTQQLPFIEFNQLQALLVNLLDILLHLVAGIVTGVLEDVPVQTEVQVDVPFYSACCEILISISNRTKDIFYTIPDVVKDITCGRVVLQSQHLLGQIGAVDALFCSSAARQSTLVALGTLEGDGHRVDHVLLVDVAGCILRRVVLNSTGAGRCRVGVDVELGAQLIFLVFRMDGRPQFVIDAGGA